MIGKILFSLLVIGLSIWLAYLWSQNPRIKLVPGEAKLILLRGGYRAWSMQFGDGMALVDGKFQPVSIKSGVLRAGYRWPEFHYVDVRPLLNP